MLETVPNCQLTREMMIIPKISGKYRDQNDAGNFPRRVYSQQLVCPVQWCVAPAKRLPEFWEICVGMRSLGPASRSRRFNIKPVPFRILWSTLHSAIFVHLSLITNNRDVRSSQNKAQNAL